MSKHSHSTYKGGEGGFPSSVILTLNFIVLLRKNQSNEVPQNIHACNQTKALRLEVLLFT